MKMHVEAEIQGVDADRKPWSAPAVRRLAAGAAENASGPTADDQVNYS